eukprot:TRINITY_DN2381_c0_g1_i2.p1 TRINITY_DN2381_c0_g1~~TRINITY_DN2381_c0_g1_i2.p1  ORF type:complete len:193 (-),score=42.24 TRINITY_DN2381_c0_g1_i2:58-636(-)
MELMKLQFESEKTAQNEAISIMQDSIKQYQFQIEKLQSIFKEEKYTYTPIEDLSDQISSSETVLGPYTPIEELKEKYASIVETENNNIGYIFNEYTGYVQEEVGKLLLEISDLKRENEANMRELKSERENEDILLSTIQSLQDQIHYLSESKETISFTVLDVLPEMKYKFGVQDETSDSGNGKEISESSSTS